MPSKRACTRRPTCRSRPGRPRLCANCKAKHADNVRAYNQRNKERLSAERPVHKKLYRLSDAQRSALFRDSDGLCALCYEEPATQIDHDHECCPGRYTCGECIRGVLCPRCNKGLGFFGKMGFDKILAYLGDNWATSGITDNKQPPDR